LFAKSQPKICFCFKPFVIVFLKWAKATSPYFKKTKLTYFFTLKTIIMLYLTTNTKDKQYDNALISASDLAAIVGLSSAIEKKEVEFTHTSIHEDLLNGGLKHSRGIELPSTFTATFNGEPFKLVYSTGKTMQTVGQSTREVNLPLEVPVLIRKPTESFLTASNKELVMYILLHPMNLSSPLYVGGVAEYRTLDREAESKLRNAVAETYEDMILDIREACQKTPQAVVRKARVLSVGARQVSGINWSLDSSEIIEQVRTGLRELAKVDPIAFKKAWEAPDIELRSIVMDCFEKGILTNVPQGQTEVVKLDGEDICRFPREEDKFIQVQKWVNVEYTKRLDQLAKKIVQNIATKETAAVKNRK
jgi:hypothetical protein